MVSKASGRHCASSRRRPSDLSFGLFTASPTDAFFRARAPSLARSSASFGGSCRVHTTGLRSPTQISSAGGRGRPCVRVVTFYGVPNTKKRKV